MAPKQKPHRSEQVVQTPADFMAAVVGQFGGINFDLAALPSNAQAPRFYTPEDDSLVCPWPDDGVNLWLNPPYSRIEPWVMKAHTTARTFRGARSRILVLVPASTGANWWRDWVHDKAEVYLLNGRLTFVGHDKPFPKDCALLDYHMGSASLDWPHYEVWDWRRDIVT